MTGKKGYFTAVRRHLFALALVLSLIYFLRTPRLVNELSADSRFYKIKTSLELVNLRVYENMVSEKVISATIQNLSHNDIKGVTVKVVWYNSEGKTVLSGERFVEKVRSGGRHALVMKFAEKPGMDRYLVYLE
ncbi:MAG: hypothetical protein ACE5GM_03225 [bacterium]